MTNDDVEKILIELNQFCNLNCSYCFYNDFGRSEKYLNLDDIKEICNKYKNANDFYLTGGECTLNNDFYQIVDFLSQKGNVTIFTNGIVFSELDNKFLKQFISKVKKIIITYDSHNPNYLLRKGYEEKVVNALKKIVDIKSDKLEIKICLNNLNFNDFDNTINYLVNLGVKHLSINFIKNITSNNTNFELSNENINKSFIIIRKYKEYFNNLNMKLMEKSYKNNFNNHVSCLAGDKFIYIDCFGKEYYCPSSCKLLDNKKDNKCFGKHCINLWEMFV